MLQNTPALEAVISGDGKKGKILCFKNKTFQASARHLFMVSPIGPSSPEVKRMTEVSEMFCLYM